jgi:phosphoglycerate-specific signal transduction histidine kinase
MAELTRDEMRERLGNIDQIRDIIFGAQLREYDNRFDKIESEVSMLQQDIQDRVEQLKTVFSTELRTTVDSLDKKIKTLTVNTQEDAADFRQQLDRLNRKFSGNIDSLNSDLEKQTNALRDELGQTRDSLQDDVRGLRAQVLEELERRFSMLKDVKVSRYDMAEILFELGMRLKGSEFVPELKEAATSNDGSQVIFPEIS